jgi:hypothetical protein
MRSGNKQVGFLTMVTLALTLSLGASRARADCVGDCHGGGEVTVDEVIEMVDIALEVAPLASCAAGDQNGDGEIAVNEIITAVNNLLNGCPAAATPTPTLAVTVPPVETATATPTASATSTALEPTVSPTATAMEDPTPSSTAAATPTPSPSQSGALSVAEAVARNADGIAVHLGETVTTEGVLTVAAGIFANNKLKIFAQDGSAGIMVYHQSSADVDAFQAGQRLRATGIIRQQDPTSDANPAIGTIAVDITQGAAVVLSDGNSLPDPQVVTLAMLNSSGTIYTGTIVRVDGVQKVSGSWPTVGSKSTQVNISDDAGTSTAVLRFQRNTITPQLVSELNVIGEGPFTLTGIVVQDDEANDGKLLSGFEIWVRGAEDVASN